MLSRGAFLWKIFTSTFNCLADVDFIRLCTTSRTRNFKRFMISTKCSFDCCDFAFVKASINPDECFVLWLPGHLSFFVIFQFRIFKNRTTIKLLSYFTVARGWLTVTIFFSIIDLSILARLFLFCRIKKPFPFLKTGATSSLLISSLCFCCCCWEKLAFTASSLLAIIWDNTAYFLANFHASSSLKLGHVLPPNPPSP